MQSLCYLVLAAAYVILRLLVLLPNTDMMKALPKQPHPTELQALHQLYQSGQLPLAEVQAQALLGRFPKSLACASKVRVN